MSLQPQPIRTLIETVLQELRKLNYSENSIVNYRRFYNRLARFAQEEGEAFYSEDFGSRFLMKYYDCRVNTITDTAPTSRLHTQIRCIRLLGDYQLHGIILRRKLGKLATTPCPVQFRCGYESFLAECRERNYSERGTYTRANRIKNFLFFLDDHGVNTCEGITPSSLSAYFGTCISQTGKTMAATLTSVRTFLRHLYLNGFMETDLTEKLPKLKTFYAPKVPRVWKPEEVRTVLDSIDRGNPTGKRDYAILLILARLGLRAVDIKDMRLESLKWDKNTLEIVQSKTKKPLVLPMLEDVGWAIIDYLKNARPATDSPFVFVRHYAPFEAFGINAALSRILVEHIRRAGVKIPRDVPKGMHSLRHTLASTLLEQNTPLPVISEILGHMSLKSTDVYLHIDIKRLRQCALDPEEVFEHGR
jgi:site-specific recombinase XerD